MLHYKLFRASLYVIFFSFCSVCWYHFIRCFSSRCSNLKCLYRASCVFSFSEFWHTWLFLLSPCRSNMTTNWMLTTEQENAIIRTPCWLLLYLCLFTMVVFDLLLSWVPYLIDVCYAFTHKAFIIPGLNVFTQGATVTKRSSVISMLPGEKMEHGTW